MRGFALLGALCLVLACDARDPRPEKAPGSLRIVSINPSLTAILVALGARDSLVGIDEVSAAQQPELAGLPRVGGLFNPSLEAVVAVAPDVVVVVPSVEQRDFRGRLEGLGVRVESFENIRLDQVLENIARLGGLVGRTEEASQRIEAIRAALASAERLTAVRPHPKALVILQRDPVFVVGSGGYIDELLAATGARNLGAAFDEPYPQVAVEWLVEAGPDVLIDMTDEPGDPHAFWSRWPAIPAVATRRVLHLDPEILTLPGPYLDRAVVSLVEALHGRSLAMQLSRR
ncbi:MAG: helical backbone metal receptor [Myxococcota bacterium]|jgi:ABC-type Fe3+-hydroxamate transport system substrate-binding protein